MTCDEALEIMSRHPAEATPEQRFRVGQHVFNCATCRFKVEMADDSEDPETKTLAVESQQWADAAGETLRKRP